MESVMAIRSGAAGLSSSPAGWLEHVRFRRTCSSSFSAGNFIGMESLRDSI
ncbi:hypothetical protein [Limobrevibacterium gyesilva]|uniref:hypothetical protein n=1 Tax=Limobrevibacterium gyesilva TaxID=2991712 RepID=UPI00222639F0|nr:hypothetical protein [Limobrevibacterium gyesilva]